jgi:hypothetical protein
MSINKLAIIFCLSLISACGRGVSNESPYQPLTLLNPPLRVSASESDAAEPSMAVSPDGSVYVAWVNHGPKKQADVMVARFSVDGKIQGQGVRVNSEAGTATAWRGDPPTIAVAPDQTVYVGWTARIESESGHSNVLYLSASSDHGQSFGAPVKVNDDLKPNPHGMHSLAIANDGRIYVAWLDERNVKPEKAPETKPASGHHKESNRELFVAFSSDGGRTFSANQSIAKEVCPCCKTALAIGPDNRIYVGWRQVLPNDFRHIAVASSADGGKTFAEPVVVSDDQWMLQGCPVSGPAFASTADGALRVLWYAGKENDEQGIYWTESRDGGKSFKPRERLTSGFANSTPVLISDGNNVPFAIWEASVNGAPRVQGAAFKDKELHGVVVAPNGELPAAITQPNRILVAYILKDGERRSVWVQTIGRAEPPPT